ncbi:hypothetical protein N7528_006915 [Penicillium herquei]|nr:hypothetical protein N7528_006915 [Penicillium herquei]
MSPSVVCPHYPVAIVGGGIAGLTLALALEKQGIDYALFERQTSLYPDQGASIGMLPNGLRILDQLGLLDEIEKHTVPLTRWRHLDGEGELILEANALGYYSSKLGYGGLFLPRRKLLEIMAKKLQTPCNARTGVRVTSLQEEQDQVFVELSDGSRVSADIVIGADGVRSRVREAIDRAQPGPLVHSDDYMRTNFACVYGISSSVDGIGEGESFSVYRPGATILLFTGQNGTIFWFVFEDLGQEYGLSSAPRYTEKDVDTICTSVAHLQISPTVYFRDVYANRSVAMKVGLEEGVAPVWHPIRMVIVGDAAHKSTPNAAMGGNQAIESSTVLINELREVLNSHEIGSLPSSALAAAFERYTHLRKPRASMIVQKAGAACRAQLYHDGAAAGIRKELPFLNDGDWLFRGFMGFSHAPTLDGLPLSSQGEFYQRATEQFQKRVLERQTGGRDVSNSALFDLEG